MFLSSALLSHIHQEWMQFPRPAYEATSRTRCPFQPFDLMISNRGKHCHPGSHPLLFPMTNFEYPWIRTGSVLHVGRRLSTRQDLQILATKTFPVAGSPVSCNSDFLSSISMSSSACRSNCLSDSTLIRHCPAVTLPISVGIRLSTT